MRFKQSVSFVFLVLLLGAGLLSFFAILGGARQTGVLRKFYWLEANTGGFNNAPATTRWFNYDWCGVENGALQECSSRSAAKPFSPRDNFGDSAALPASFVEKRKTYYYLSRVAWAMLLVGIFFIVCAIVPLVATAFTASVWAGSFAALTLWLALFFVTLSACLYTGCYVKARNSFADSGRRAKLGKKNFAFIWTSVALLLACAIWSTVATAVFGVKKMHANKRYSYGSDSFDAGDKATTLDTYGNSDNRSHSPRRFKFYKKVRHQQVYTEPAVPASEYDNGGAPVARPFSGNSEKGGETERNTERSTGHATEDTHARNRTAPTSSTTTTIITSSTTSNNPVVPQQARRGLKAFQDDDSSNSGTKTWGGAGSKEDSSGSSNVEQRAGDTHGHFNSHQKSQGYTERHPTRELDDQVAGLSSPSSTSQPTNRPQVFSTTLPIDSPQLGKSSTTPSSTTSSAEQHKRGFFGKKGPKNASEPATKDSSGPKNAIFRDAIDFKNKINEQRKHFGRKNSTGESNSPATHAASSAVHHESVRHGGSHNTSVPHEETSHLQGYHNAGVGYEDPHKNPANIEHKGVTGSHQQGVVPPPISRDNDASKYPTHGRDGNRQPVKDDDVNRHGAQGADSQQSGILLAGVRYGTTPHDESHVEGNRHEGDHHGLGHHDNSHHESGHRGVSHHEGSHHATGYSGGANLGSTSNDGTRLEGTHSDQQHQFSKESNLPNLEHDYERNAVIPGAFNTQTEPLSSEGHHDQSRARETGNSQIGTTKATGQSASTKYPVETPHHTMYSGNETRVPTEAETPSQFKYGSDADTSKQRHETKHTKKNAMGLEGYHDISATLPEDHEMHLSKDEEAGYEEYRPSGHEESGDAEGRRRSSLASSNEENGERSRAKSRSMSLGNTPLVGLVRTLSGKSHQQTSHASETAAAAETAAPESGHSETKGHSPTNSSEGHTEQPTSKITATFKEAWGAMTGRRRSSRSEAETKDSEGVEGTHGKDIAPTNVSRDKSSTSGNAQNVESGKQQYASTDADSSDHADVYAREVVNMPSLVEPTELTYGAVGRRKSSVDDNHQSYVTQGSHGNRNVSVGSATHHEQMLDTSQAPVERAKYAPEESTPRGARFDELKEGHIDSHHKQEPYEQPSNAVPQTFSERTQQNVI